MGAPETERERGFPECSTVLGCTIKVVVRNWRIWPSAEADALAAAADDARQEDENRQTQFHRMQCNARN